MTKKSMAYNYPEEIMIGSNLIFDFYTNNNETNKLDIELEKYIKYINELLNSSIYEIMVSK
jgi:hypothetical protein